MAKKCLIVKQQKPQKFSVRKRNRCAHCGRARAFLRRFGLCRICVRKFSSLGVIPGVIKSSW
jgi:small subunit ribosomal protein S14